MAKILEQKEKKARCSECECKFSYTYHETREVKHYDYGGGCDVNRVVTCPSCGYSVTVSAR